VPDSDDPLPDGAASHGDRVPDGAASHGDRGVCADATGGPDRRA
jgi:hypothetical protein